MPEQQLAAVCNAQIVLHYFEEAHTFTESVRADAKFLAYYSFQSIQQELQRVPAVHQLQMPIVGMLCGAVQAVPPSEDTSPQEQWLQVQPHNTSLQAVQQARVEEERVQNDLRHLHTVAQQLSCGCNHDIEVVGADGQPVDDTHGDFAFLQRGRLGASGLS